LQYASEKIVKKFTKKQQFEVEYISSLNYVDMASFIQKKRKPAARNEIREKEMATILIVVICEHKA
jgi:hypothetical protein